MKYDTMPRLITRTDRKSSAPVAYFPAHSPWQRLVDEAQRTKKLTYRQLAKQVGVHPGTLWIWIHSENGHPSPQSGTAERMKRLAAALQIPLPHMLAALDESRRLFTAPGPTQSESIDAFRAFLRVLEADTRQRVPRKAILNLGKRMLASSEAAISQPSRTRGGFNKGSKPGKTVPRV